ncbi:14992_t:CDS:1, partial [Racocetra fulgida]
YRYWTELHNKEKPTEQKFATKTNEQKSVTVTKQNQYHNRS